MSHAGTMLAVLSLLALGGCASAAASPARVASGYHAAPASQRFGINAQIMFWSLSGVDWHRQVAEMRSDGIETVRADAPWAAVQPTSQDGSTGRFEWSSLDRIVGTLAVQGLRWLPVVDYSAPWAASATNAGGSPDLFSPPSHDAMFARYAAALVARYGPGGTFWRRYRWLTPRPVAALEIWNEENTAYFWHPAPDPAAYLRLYEASRRAVHAVDPAAEVLVGGIAGDPATFLDTLYAAAAGRRAPAFDGVALHPYANAVSDALAYVTGARRVLDDHGDLDIPLDVTEVGWPSITSHSGLSGLLPHPASSSGISYVSDAQRASDLSTLTSTLAGSDCGIERILPDTWVTAEQDTGNAEDWYGIVHPSGAPSQTATAYRDVLASLEHAGGRTARASGTLCGRSLTLATVPVGRATRSGSRRACVAVAARSGSYGIDGATVTLAGPGIRPRRTVTDRTGTATFCLGPRAPHAAAVALTASRPDFAQTPQVHARLR